MIHAVEIWSTRTLAEGLAVPFFAVEGFDSASGGLALGGFSSFSALPGAEVAGGGAASGGLAFPP